MPLARLVQLFSLTRRGEQEESAFLPTRPAWLAHSGSEDLVFRLRRWPAMVEVERSAERYKLLSLMSVQPITRRWLHKHSGMPPRDLDRFITELADCGAVDVIDPAASD